MFSKILILAISIITASAAQILLKRGTFSFNNLGFSPAKIFYIIPVILRNVWLMGGIFLYGISLLSYIFALSYFQLSVAYPISVSAGIILISLFSRLLFRESLGLFQIAGIMLMILGIFLLAT